MPKKKSTKNRPGKLASSKLLEQVNEALNEKNYYFTVHALERSEQRKNLNDYQVIKILKSKAKYHEPKKDEFNEDFNSWNYSIRGVSVDQERVRIIVSFDENDMLIITVINLDE